MSPQAAAPENKPTSSTEAKSKVQITVYYWPGINFGRGHISCVAREVGGGKRAMYISSSSYHSGCIYGPTIIDESSGREKPSPEEYFYALRSDVEYCDSPNISQINLPASDISYDDFVTTFQKYSWDFFRDDPIFFSRNCAHLVNQVLHIAYPDDMQLEDKIGLWPSTVAEHAIFLAGDSSSNARKNIHLKFQRGLPGDYDKFRFAWDMIGVITTEMKHQYGVNLDEFLLELKKVRKEVDQRRYNFETGDNKLTEIFLQLQPKLKEIEKKLADEQKGFFIRLKFLLYGFIRIFSQDPKLEYLRKFKKTVNTITDFNEFKKEQLKFRETTMGATKEPESSTLRPG